MRKIFNSGAWFWAPNVVGFCLLWWAAYYLLFLAQSNARFAVLIVPIGFLLWAYRKSPAFLIGGSLIVANGLIWLIVVRGQDIYMSVRSRVELAINTLAMIADSPIWGHGTGSYNYDYPRFQEAHFGTLPGKYTVIGDVTIFAGNAHNLLLQIWAEHGIIGVIFGCWIVYEILKRYREKKRDGIDVACLWTLCLFFVLSLFGFPLYNAPTAIIVIVCAALICQGGEPVKTIQGWRPVPAYAAGLIAFGLVAWSGFAYAGQMQFAITRLIIDQNPLRAFEANVRAYDIYPLEQHYRRQLPLSLAKVLAIYKERVMVAPDAADKAHRIGLSAAPQSPASAIARVEYLLNSGRWTNKEEMEELLATMKSTAGEHAVSWIADALYAAKLDDAARFMSSVEKAKKATHYHQLHKDYLKYLATLVEETKK